MNRTYSFKKAPPCSATSKRTRERCKAPAVRGWTVCRFHGRTERKTQRNVQTRASYKRGGEGAPFPTGVSSTIARARVIDQDVDTRLLVSNLSGHAFHLGEACEISKMCGVGEARRAVANSRKGRLAAGFVSRN